MGPRGRSGKPGSNGIPGIPGINAWKVKLENGSYSAELLVPPSITGKRISTSYLTFNSLVKYIQNIISNIMIINIIRMT